MAVRINLEIGHEASLRTKRTPEGFTHDWKVFVRGCDGAEIHHYIEKVVFYLHETFQKPKRVVKEPPYCVKESGYAGFNLPIDVYLRNNGEPKKIKFNYDLHLQPTGPPITKALKEKYIFNSPPDDFKHKLLKGGGVVTSATSSSQDSSESRSILNEEKNQLTSKPKLSGSEIAKKHKIEPVVSNSFQDLFGTPITKTSRIVEPVKAPTKDNKNNVKSEKANVKSKHKDKEKEKDRDRDKSEKKTKDEKRSKEKIHEKEKSLDKMKEKNIKREKSPRPASLSPKRSPSRLSSPSPVPSTASTTKHRDKESRDSKIDKEKREKTEEKKPKKEKKDKEHSKDKDKYRNSAKAEHKNKESKSKDSVKEKEVSPPPVAILQPQTSSQSKIDKKDKAKEEEKVEKIKPEKPERSDDKQKHKHKKKDKDRKEKKEEKQQKSPKKAEKNVPVVNSQLSANNGAVDTSSSSVLNGKETVLDKSNLFGSPKSAPSPVPLPPKEKEKPPKPIAKVAPLMEQVSDPSPSSREPSPFPPVKKKEKMKKKERRGSEKDHEKKRKRKASPPIEQQPPEKVTKDEDSVNNNSDSESSKPMDSSKEIEKLEAEDYMSILRELQHKIMGLKDNADLQKVVQLIAETGQYEISAHTFDFDLCLLDRSTVKQLQDVLSTTS